MRVPADHLLGEVNGGWTVALTTLMNERAAIGGGGGGAAPGKNELRRLQALADHLDVAQDPLIRQRFADVYIHIEVARYNNERALAAIRSGSLPGPELSVARISLTENMRRIADLAAAILGLRLVADSGEWGTYAWSRYVLGVPGMRVAGGTDEIMRNILGDRVLGLPKDPSPKASPRTLAQSTQGPVATGQLATGKGAGLVPPHGDAMGRRRLSRPPPTPSGQQQETISNSSAADSGSSAKASIPSAAASASSAAASGRNSRPPTKAQLFR